MLWFAWICFRSWGYRVVGALAVVGVLAVAVNLPHLARNYDTFNSVSDPAIIKVTRNADPGLSALVSNLARNSAMEAATPFHDVNQVLDPGTGPSVPPHAGMDINDPDTTLSVDPVPRFYLPDGDYLFHEDGAANPLHLLLLVIALVVVGGLAVTCARASDSSHSSSEAAILFCLVFRWQIYSTG